MAVVDNDVMKQRGGKKKLKATTRAGSWWFFVLPKIWGQSKVDGSSENVRSCKGVCTLGNTLGSNRGVVVRMQAKLDDGVNRGAGIQEDRSGGTQSETNETPIGDGKTDTCDEWVEGEATEYRDVLIFTEADMMRKVFCTDEAAYEFYKRYGKCHGFGIRKGDSGKNDKGRVIRRRFFCNKAGLRQCKHYERLDRKRDHRSEMRTNCDTKLSILWDDVSKIWRVRKVILDHNHDLTPMRMVHMINSFRDMDCSAKAQINGM
ncbi:putative protein FAR1-RELATED SEQUENCE 10 isoform X1 [Arachis ipaensis]|uniref:putative protein FAR1-RELATED SEQUENCE 10 isoform X1 n=2 Tax=Arachis ipaensis TaxID=130454 RepID=UPI000A2B1D19|nr:putative protein FAR1-RELATED SEQUENCE 10 isoform X1 [Arachis ipaensis]